MAATTVRANLACLGLARHDVVTIEKTPFVEAVIAHGYLTEVNGEREANHWSNVPGATPGQVCPQAPIWQCPVCLVERADVDGPGQWLDSCPNCGTTLAPELGL